MTPGTLAFALWEGSAALGLTVEYALMPEQCHSEEKRELFERYTAVYGPWHLAAVVTGLGRNVYDVTVPQTFTDRQLVNLLSKTVG